MSSVTPVSCTAVLLVSLASSALGASFRALPGRHAQGVSDDGRIVAGYGVYSDNYEAVLWENGTLLRLGDLPGGAVDAIASGISGDGRVVVGRGTTATAQQAFYWKEGSFTPLPFIPGFSGPSIAQSASYDGSVIVGYSQSTYGPLPVRWINGTLSVLPPLPGTYHAGQASGVSGNGRFVAGKDSRWNGSAWIDQAVIWRDGVVSPLGYLHSSDRYSSGLAVSDDGQVVVGMSGGPGLEAFRWANGTMTSLGFIPGGTVSTAFGVSGDGQIVVGASTSPMGEQAAIWDAEHGMRSLRDVLISDFGLPLEGWTLFTADSISRNGRFIVGAGRNPTGALMGWIAEIPEPTTLLLLLTGALTLRRRRSA